MVVIVVVMLLSLVLGVCGCHCYGGIVTGTWALRQAL